MTLKRIAAGKWAFLMGRNIKRLNDTAPLYYLARWEAVNAARLEGLCVLDDGRIY